MFLTLLPTWLKELLVGLLAFGLAILSAWLYGEHRYEQGVKAEVAIQVSLEAKVDASSLAATTPIVFALETAQVKYQAATQTIIKEVPTYVSKEDDAHCTVPNGFVSLWDSANKMQLPSGASAIPSGTSQVVLSDIATQHTVESGIAHDNEFRLIAIQDWLRAQQVVYSTTR